MLTDENKLRHDSLYNFGKKHAYAKALNLLRSQPAEQAIRIIFEELCRTEDREMEIDRQLECEEVLTARHACI